MNIDDDIQGAQLAPGITKRGVDVYEIPEDASSYYLVAMKAGTNDTYRVKLK